MASPLPRAPHPTHPTPPHPHPQVNPEAFQWACFQTNGSASLTSFLPDPTNYTYMGVDIVNGQACNWWQNSVQMYSRVSTYDLYISKATNTPVQLAFLGYDSVLGSHYDQYFCACRCCCCLRLVAPLTAPPPHMPTPPAPNSHLQHVFGGQRVLPGQHL